MTDNFERIACDLPNGGTNLLNSNFINCILTDGEPVSYTHLDVYKRQDYMRAEYVIEEIQRVLDVCDALEKDDYETVGQKMYETHHGMSKLYEVSCEELDFLNDCLLYTSRCV